MPMDTIRKEALEAKFASQDQAESAIRKLASLRGDCFRMERCGDSDRERAAPGAVSGEVQDQTWDAEIGEIPAALPADSVFAFTLSANVPDAALKQAREVIRQAGGVLL